MVAQGVMGCPYSVPDKPKHLVNLSVKMYSNTPENIHHDESGYQDLQFVMKPNFSDVFLIDRFLKEFV